MESVIIYEFNEAKNKLLLQERNICFETVIKAIEQGHLLDVKSHPDQKRYPGQEMYIVDIDDYTYIVPFVQNEEKIFLKTIFPSRKTHKQYLRVRGDK